MELNKHNVKLNEQGLYQEWYKNFQKGISCLRCCGSVVKIKPNTDKLTCNSCGYVFLEKDKDKSFWWKCGSSRK